MPVMPRCADVPASLIVLLFARDEKGNCFYLCLVTCAQSELPAPPHKSEQIVPLAPRKHSSPPPRKERVFPPSASPFRPNLHPSSHSLALARTSVCRRAKRRKISVEFFQIDPLRMFFGCSKRQSAKCKSGKSKCEAKGRKEHKASGDSLPGGGLICGRHSSWTSDNKLAQRETETWTGTEREKAFRLGQTATSLRRKGGTPKSDASRQWKVLLFSLLLARSLAFFIPNSHQQFHHLMMPSESDSPQLARRA